MEAILEPGNTFIGGFFLGLFILAMVRIYEWNRYGRPREMDFRLLDIAYLMVYFVAVQAMILASFLALQQLIRPVTLIIILSLLMGFFIYIAILGRVTKQAKEAAGKSE